MHLLHAAQLAPVQRVSGYGLRGELDPPRLGVLDKLHVMVLVHGLGLGVLNKLRFNPARTARKLLFRKLLLDDLPPASEVGRK